MRLLLTTDTIGGVWTFTRELTEQLVSRGHSVALVSFGRIPSQPQQAWCDRIMANHPDAFFYHGSGIPLEWMQNNDSFYDAGVAVLLNIARRFKPDLIHTNQYCFGALPLDISKLITAHSDVLSWTAACRPDGLVPSPWLDRYRALVQRGLDEADAVVAPTVWMLDSLSGNFEVRCTAKVIFNGRTLSEDTSRAPRTLQAVSVGRLWDEAKGLSTLLSIEPAMPFLVTGELDFEASSMPARMAGITMLGMLAEEELFSLFRASSIYVVTSLYEPFGLAPLEAALCGCAIVARDIPSLREVWGEAATYFRDTSDLELLLQALAADSEKLQGAQAAAVRRAKELTSARMADSYLAFYETLVRSKQSHKEHAFHAA